MNFKRYLLLIFVITLFSFIWFHAHLLRSTFETDIRPFLLHARNSSFTDEYTTLTTALKKKSKNRISLPQLNLLNNVPNCRELFQIGSMVGADKWTTEVCKSRSYAWSELGTCLRQRNATHNIVLIGDSRVRQMKDWILNYMENASIPSMRRHEHMDTTNDQPLLNLRIQFFWESYISQRVTDLFNKWISVKGIGTDVPDMIIIGIGTWYVKLESEDLLNAASVINRYEESLRRLSSVMKELNKYIPVIWIKQAPVDMFRFRNTPQLRNITEYNDVTERIFSETNCSTLWRSAFTIANELYSQSPDAMHYSDNVTETLINILWNFYCNSKLDIGIDDCCTTIPALETSTDDSVT